jgi:amino acid transporter
MQSFSSHDLSGPFGESEASSEQPESMPNGSAHSHQEHNSFRGENDGPFRSNNAIMVRSDRHHDPEGTHGIHPDEGRGSPDDESLHRPPTDFTEDRRLGRTLGTLDVSALILNKMVGTGIFTLPGIVLGLTRSKRISVGFWVVGGVYSMLSFSIYLEYGINFPYNGGDLIYLDEVWPSPELLSTVLYSGYFICFGNSAGNSVAFAKHVVAASSAEIVLSTKFDKRLVNLVAVSILTIICFINYFSKDAGLFLNKLLAWYKVGLLSTVFIAGVVVRNQPGSGISDWGEYHEGRSVADTLSALIYILYSFQGWENANYVAGEIKADKPTLQRGGFLAIITVTLLYGLATVGYYLACPFDQIISSDSDLGMAQYFASRAFGGHTTAFKICIALSAVGNLVAVVFTSSKVKQSIARQRIIPWHKFFAQDDVHFGTPGGALILHWASSFILILAMPNTADGYGFVIGLFTYGHLLIGLFVGCGIFRLRHRINHRKSIKERRQSWEFEFLRPTSLRTTVVVIFNCLNLLALIMSARPRDPDFIAKFWWPVIMAGVAAGSAIYWFALWSLQESGKVGNARWRWLARWTGVHVRAYHGDEAVGTEYEEEMKKATRDGTNRRVEYEFAGTRWKRLDRGWKWVWDVFYRYLW